LAIIITADPHQRRVFDVRVTGDPPPRRAFAIRVTADHYSDAF